MTRSDEKRAARLRREQAEAAASASAGRTRRIQILAGTVFAAIVVVLLVVFVGGGGRERPTSGKVLGVAETRALLRGVPQDGLTLGDPDAPVTILEFLDVQCPYCRDHQLDGQPAVIRELVRTGRAQLRVQPVALEMMGEDSVAGRAVALRLARADRAWEFLNLFYWNQLDEGTGYVTSSYLDRLLAAIPGAPRDTTRTVDAQDAPVVKAIDRAELALAKKYARDGETFGTPAFAVGPSRAPATTYEPVYLTGKEPAVDLIGAAVRKVEAGRGSGAGA